MLPNQLIFKKPKLLAKFGKLTLMCAVRTIGTFALNMPPKKNEYKTFVIFAKDSCNKQRGQKLPTLLICHHCNSS